MPSDIWMCVCEVVMVSGSQSIEYKHSFLRTISLSFHTFINHILFWVNALEIENCCKDVYKHLFKLMLSMLQFDVSSSYVYTYVCASACMCMSSYPCAVSVNICLLKQEHTNSHSCTRHTPTCIVPLNKKMLQHKDPTQFVKHFARASLTKCALWSVSLCLCVAI